MISILGLPGLYQNWLLATLDPDSQFSISQGANFEIQTSAVIWHQKLETDIDLIDCNSVVVNTYVSYANFVWYLYNFLEKTDSVNIKVESLVDNLQLQAPGTRAFDKLLTHFFKSYNLDSNLDSEYKNNAAIEYFYFLLLDQESKFKKTSALTNSAFINIEYLDFANYNTLKQKLVSIDSFDSAHFDKMYQLLQQRNLYYLDRRNNFLKKLESNHKNFDILEQSYIGALLTWRFSTVYDWFNPDTRSQIISDHWDNICNISNLQT